MLGDQLDADPRLFALFASREDQMRYVLKNMAFVGVNEIGLVYPTAQQAQALQSGMDAIASRLRMKTRTMVIPQGKDIADYAAQLPANAPFYLLFMGGSIELALFTQGLARRGAQRYAKANRQRRQRAARRMRRAKRASRIASQTNALEQRR